MPDKPKDSEQMEVGDNVEQIREILFGGHIRAFDERFGLVEDRLSKESRSLRKAIEKRVEDLERLLSDFREEATDQLGTEASNRDLALNKLELALSQARVDAENQMALMEDRFAAELKEIRADLKAMHKELSSALTKADRAQVRRVDKLDADKVTRKDLSTLFTELAKNINPVKPGRGK